MKPGCLNSSASRFEHHIVTAVRLGHCRCQMHNALCAIEMEAVRLGNWSDSLMDNGHNWSMPHDVLERVLHDFSWQEQQILSGDRCEVSHTSEYLTRVLHDHKCHAVMFGDHIHWRVILLDGRSKIAYCMDPYGNEGPLSFLSRQPQQVLSALEAMLSGRHGWSIRITQTPWQHWSDSHSCGMWVIWLCEMFMKFVAQGEEGSDFETWAASNAEIPSQQALRAKYYDMYYGQNGSRPTRRQGSTRRSSSLHIKAIEKTKYMESS